MRWRAAFWLLIICLMSSNTCLALDWKRLHEEADRLSIADALSLTGKNPDSPEDLYRLGLVYLSQHKDKAAEAVFRRILSISPDIFEAEWGAAESLRRQHMFQDSLRGLQIVFARDPDFAPALISMAYIKYIQSDFNSCVLIVLKVMRQGRDKIDLSNYMRSYALYAGAKGMIAHYGGPLSKAVNGTAVLPNLRKAERIQPDAAEVLSGIGSFYLLAPSLAGGNLEQAQIYLTRAIKIDPLFCDAYVRLAQLYKLRGDLAKYEAYLAKALEIDPQSEVALDIKNETCKFICIKR